MNALQLLNPAGAMAFAAIAVLLAIHMLQRRNRTMRIATRFLLPAAPVAGHRGNLLQKLHRSALLWWQVAAVSILAGLATRPVWRSDQPGQRMVIVLDESASMSVFPRETLGALDRIRHQIATAAGRFELVLLSSADGRPLEDAGPGSLPADYHPLQRSHDAARALDQAAVLAGSGGVVIFLTDSPMAPEDAARAPRSGSPASDVHTVAIGRPIDNTGFAGIATTQDRWQAWIGNWGHAPVTRVVTGPEGTLLHLHLQPGTLATVDGPLPDDGTPATLSITNPGQGAPEPFSMDDQALLVRPTPRPVRTAIATHPAHTPLAQRLSDALPHTTASTDIATADLVWCSYDPLDPKWPHQQAVIFVRDPGTPPGTDPLEITVAEPDPLVKGLPLDTLLAARSLRIPPTKNDRVLAWQGNLPLIFLRGGALSQQLAFNFDPARSNLATQSWLPILIHRFAEMLRRTLSGIEHANVYTGQPLDVPGPGPWTLHSGNRTLEHRHVPIFAPLSPGLFQIHNREGQVFSGAARFEDVRESDFRDRSPTPPAIVPIAAPGGTHHNPLPLDAAGGVVLLACAIVSWAVAARHGAFSHR